MRSITYRSTDSHRFDTVSRQITDLKKEVNKREQQKKELADVIEQDVLVEMKGRRPHKLPEVFVRPAPDGKRLPGEVEIHQNGLRYHSPLGTQKTGKLFDSRGCPVIVLKCIQDVLFSNVRHLFFQPCDHELLVIIHVHLKAPIMIGKKKTHVGPHDTQMLLMTNSTNRMYNSTERHRMFSSTKPVIASVSTGTATKTR